MVGRRGKGSSELREGWKTLRRQKFRGAVMVAHRWTGFRHGEPKTRRLRFFLRQLFDNESGRRKPTMMTMAMTIMMKRENKERSYPSIDLGDVVEGSDEGSGLLRVPSLLSSLPPVLYLTTLIVFNSFLCIIFTSITRTDTLSRKISRCIPTLVHACIYFDAARRRNCGPRTRKF